MRWHVARLPGALMDTVLKLGHQLYIIFFLNIVDSKCSTIVKISLSLRLSCLNVLIGDTYTYHSRGEDLIRFLLQPSYLHYSSSVKSNEESTELINKLEK